MNTSLVRIAPTPSGYLHPGNMVNFLLNAALVPPGGGLLLRIDDLDRGRFRRPYLEDIFRVLGRLSIHPTAGPRDVQDFGSRWSQEYRMPLYQAALAALAGNPLVFACRCSRKELAKEEHPHGCLAGLVDFEEPQTAWRVATHELTQHVGVELLDGTKQLVNVHQAAPFFAVRRKNGRPSYQLASVIDDLHYGVTMAARGEDLMPSTAAQSVIAQLLHREEAFGKVRYLHHPLISGPDGSKLSKSSGRQSEPYQITDEQSQVWRATVHRWLSTAPPGLNLPQP